MLGIKTISENAFDGVISRLDTVNERISELEDMLIEISKIEKQREKNTENKTEYLRTMGQLQNVYYTHTRNKGREVVTENFPKIMPEPNHRSTVLSKHQVG